MGKLKEIQEAYFGQEEKVIVKKDKMGFVQALGILHGLRDSLSACGEIYEAFQVVFEWIDNVVILLHGLGGGFKNESAAIPASMSGAAGDDQYDRSDS